MFRFNTEKAIHIKSRHKHKTGTNGGYSMPSSVGDHK